MITISLCMIVKNEEKVLKRCLDSIKPVIDEIIIVDTGSTDATKDISLKYTDKVFDFEWTNDFSAARNFSFEQASMDYIMWLDADDVMLEEDLAKFAVLKKSMTGEIDSIMMKYNTGFDENGKVTFSYFRERLSKRSMNFKWKEPVHEYLEFGGKILNSDICITHTKQSQQKTRRNIQIYEDTLDKQGKLSPRGMYYYARELMEHGMYKEAIKWFNLFLEEGKGWIEDNITACGELAKCYRYDNKPNESLNSMFRSFNFDVPRAEICCQIGDYFIGLKNYKLAIFWFESVLKLERNKSNWGFSQIDCWGYIPCIRCAVCYDKLGKYQKASDYNEKAAEYKPNSAAVLYNKKYFEEKLQELNATKA